MKIVARVCQQPWFLLLLLGALWGSGYTLARFATTHGVSPLGYAFWQCFGPALVLFFYLLLRSERIQFKWSYVLYFMLIGFIGIALPNTNMYFSSQYLPAGMLAIVVNTVPVFIYLLALAVGEERWDIWRVLALLCLCFGLFLLLYPLFHLHSSDRMSPYWILISFLSPLLFALTAVFIANNSQTQNIPVSVLAFGMMLAATIWLIPVVLVKSDFYWPGPHWQSRDWAIVGEIILSSVGYIVFFQLLKLAGSVYYSFVSGVVAIMGVIWGQLFFNERFSFLDSISMLCIFMATVTVVLTSLRRE